MPRVTKKPTEDVPTARMPDALEVIHHEVPRDAAGLAAVPVAAPASAPAATRLTTYQDGGMTWRRMLRGIAITEAVGMTVLLVAGLAYGMSFFAPLALAAALYIGAAAWLPRMSKAGTVYTLVVASLTLVMFGGMFFGWTGFLYPQSWFEESFATLTVLLPIAGIVAAVATLRHKDGQDAARTAALGVAALATVIVAVGIVGSAASSDPTRLPGDTTVTASDFEFATKAITAKAGDVSIYFANEDPFAHNVKIDGYGTSDIAQGRMSIRHTFKNVKAGTYEFICAIHPDMTGTLTVT
jgi:plastocyanin